MPFFSLTELIMKNNEIRIAIKSDKNGPVTNASGNKQSNQHSQGLQYC